MPSRLNVNINDETERALRELADERQTSVTEVVRRAVAVYKMVEDELAAGKSLHLVDESTKSVEKLRLIR